MLRLTRRRFLGLAGASAGALASLALFAGDEVSSPPRFNLFLGPSNGIDDTEPLQAAIDKAAALATDYGIPGTVHGRRRETYRVSYTGRLTSIPRVGRVRAALSLASDVSLEGLNLQAPDWPDEQAAVLVAETGVNHWGVRNCNVDGAAPRGLTTEYLHNAVMLGACSNVRIDGNTFSRFRSAGVSGISASNVISSAITIQGNLITLCQGGAIKFGNGVSDLLIADNRCIDNLGIVSGSYSGAECILLNDSKGNNFRIRVTGNVLANWGACIVFGGASDVTIRGNYLAPPPGGACFATSPGFLTDAQLLNNTMVGAVNAAALDIPRSSRVQVRHNSFYGRYVNPVFLREIGVADSNDYRDNELGVTAEGAGAVRIITQPGSVSQIAPQCNVGRRPTAHRPSATGTSFAGPVCSDGTS